MQCNKQNFYHSRHLSVRPFWTQFVVGLSFLVTTGALAMDTSALPSAAVARVPVDANGQQVAELAELRLVDSDVAPENETSDSIAKAFDGGREATILPEDGILDELDRDRSTEAFWGWRRHYYRCHAGCGLEYRPVVYVGPVTYTYAAPVYYYAPAVSYVYTAPATIVGYSYYYYPSFSGVVVGY